MLGSTWALPLLSALAASLLTTLALFARRRVIEARALSRSRAVLKGQLSEQLAPLARDFAHASKDARFLGHPIDYVVFSGLSDDDAGIEIVFVEVKTGKARVTRNESRVARAVREGRVRFEVVRLPT